MKARGFTMIELLVVLAILGVLMALGAGAYTKSLARGRDAKRVEDMKQIQRGFEQYYSLEGSYDDECGTMFDEVGVFPSGEPTAPMTGVDYVGDCDVSSYIYCAGLENPLDYGNATCSGSEATSCLPASTAQTHYCVFSVQ
jgi:prepilin-type N-terminal cleavage/methylation domain-containing protein